MASSGWDLEEVVPCVRWQGILIKSDRKSVWNIPGLLVYGLREGSDHSNILTRGDVRHGANNPTRGGGDGSQDGARSPARSLSSEVTSLLRRIDRPTECWKESGPSERCSLVVVVKQGGLVFGRGGRISGPWKRNSNVISKCASDTSPERGQSEEHSPNSLTS